MNEREFTVSSSQAYGNNYREEGTFGTAKFTATKYSDGFTRDEDHSVEVRATFNPETKTWTAEIVRQWEGRY